jgi:hypothetical protein
MELWQRFYCNDFSFVGQARKILGKVSEVGTDVNHHEFWFDDALDKIMKFENLLKLELTTNDL